MSTSGHLPESCGVSLEKQSPLLPKTPWPNGSLMLACQFSVRVAFFSEVGTEGQLRRCEDLSQSGAHCVLQPPWVVRGGQTVRDPTPCLGPKWKQDVGEHRCEDG